MPTTYYRGWNEPYYTGSAAAATAVSTVLVFDVVINGRGYMLDLENPDTPPYSFQSIPMLDKDFGAGSTDRPMGENALNPDDYWRRSVDDWSAGAGQKFLDHPLSSPNRFHTSKGVDPWTEGQLSLLPVTAQKHTSANTNLEMVVAGTYLYYLDGTALRRTADITVTTPTFTTITPAGGDAALSSATDMTSDGYTVWVCDGTRVHYTTRGAATFDKYHTADHVATRVQIAKGRLFTTNGRTIYSHSGAPGAAVATVYFTHPNSDWVWTAIAEGTDAIYFAGYSGHVSYIYAATIKSDGTALDIPVVVATLPIGETVRALRAYFSVLMIGTDLGLRAAAIGSQSGPLTLGSLVETPGLVGCFEAQSRFVWFGWTNYDLTSSGIGRADLSKFNNDVPAYASDLMAPVRSPVTSIVTFNNLRAFTVSGHGIYAETTDKVASGSVVSGWLNYALVDPKLAIKMSVQHRAGAGIYQVSLAKDDAPAVNVGLPVVTSGIAGNSETISLPQIQGRAFEVTFVLTRNATDTTAGPVLDRMTLMVEPQPARRAKFMVPILLKSSQRLRNGTTVKYDAAEERRRFHNLLQNRSIFTFQDCEQTYPVICDNFTWVPYELVRDVARSWDGTLVVELKVML